jgi:hypothetical protein
MEQNINNFSFLKVSYLIILCLFLFVLQSYAQPANREEFTKKAAKYWDTLKTEHMRLVNKTIHLEGGKTVVLCGTRHDNRNPQDSMYKNLEQQFRLLSPSLVLVENYQSTYRTKEETIMMVGDGGFCKFLAFENGIEANSWDLYLGESYYELKKKFKAEDIFASLFINYLLMLQPPPGESFEAFYPKFASATEIEGMPLTVEQKKPEYFFKVFYKYVGVNFSLRPSVHDQAIIDKKTEQGILKSVFSQMEAIRELHFIDVLTDRLRKYDKIFVQCGAGHVGPFEQVIANMKPGSISNNNKAVNPALQKNIAQLFPEHRSTDPGIKELKLGDKKVTVWATSATSDFLNNDICKEAEKKIHGKKKTLVLIDGLTFLKQNPETTNSWYGNTGVSRFIAQKNNIPVKSWAGFFSPLYFSLCRKYNNEDVYYAMLFHQLLRYKNAAVNYPTLDKYFDFVGTTLERARFPFSYNSAQFDNFYNNSRKYFADKRVSTNETTGDYLSKVEIALSDNLQLAPIIASMKVIRNAELIDQLEKALNDYDEVFLQTDVEYLTTPL